MNKIKFRPDKLQRLISDEPSAYESRKFATNVNYLLLIVTL